MKWASFSTPMPLRTAQRENYSTSWLFWVLVLHTGTDIWWSHHTSMEVSVQLHLKELIQFQRLFSGSQEILLKLVAPDAFKETKAECVYVGATSYEFFHLKQSPLNILGVWSCLVQNETQHKGIRENLGVVKFEEFKLLLEDYSKTGWKVN